MKKRCFPVTASGTQDGIKTTDEYQRKNRCHHEALINVSGNPKSTTRISACIEATCNDDNAEPAILSVEALSFSILPNLSMADAKVGVSRSTSALGGRPMSFCRTGRAVLLVSQLVARAMHVTTATTG